MGTRDVEAERRLIEAIHADPGDERDDGSTALLLFDVASRRFAVPVAAVEEVTEAGFVAPAPFAPESVVGVASVRGRMRLVVDVGGASPESSAYFVLVRGDAQLAVLADRVVGVRSVSSVDPTAELDGARVLDPESLLES